VSDERVKPPIWYWGVVGVALLWNALGVVAFIAQVSMGPEALAQLSEIERSIHESTPIWATAAFGVATFGGLLGCVLLLFRTRFAGPVLVMSLLGIAVQMIHGLAMTEAVALLGPQVAVLPSLILVVALFLVAFFGGAHSRRWIQ